MNFNINDTFNKELPADELSENTRRQVRQACYSFVMPRKTSKPEMVHLSHDMLNELNISKDEANSDIFRNVMTGNEIVPDTNPYAMCYGGHQFGYWAGQLGDGRAINLFETLNKNRRWALQLKGAGETPYSRRADGLAVLRSSIREYLCSEAMFHLGVPTTRALSLALTGDKVLRDVMYDGNPEYEKGAIVCRVSPSFIRFGNFEIFAARKEQGVLKNLIDYTIKFFYSDLGKPSRDTYVIFFKEVAKRSLEMIVHWQRVGFVHGVMNTDNMSILGLTIDYGPYGWLEGYDKGWTPNTTDSQNKRYRYGAQPDVMLWNLYQLANALYPLIGETQGLEKVLKSFGDDYTRAYLKMMKSKIGLQKDGMNDEKLIRDLERNLELTETDMTIFFRQLGKFKPDLPADGIHIIQDAFYKPSELTGKIQEFWNLWFTEYANRLKTEKSTDLERKSQMDKVNPKYVLRNYMAQLAIDEADKGNYSLIEEMYQLLRKPYESQPKMEKWFVKRPEWARNKVGCSMLSCSS